MVQHTYFTQDFYYSVPLNTLCEISPHHYKISKPTFVFQSPLILWNYQSNYQTFKKFYQPTLKKVVQKF